MGLKSFIIKTAVNFVKPYVKAELTVDNLCEIGTGAIDWAASAVTKGVDDADLAKVTRGCSLGASVLGNVAAALDPASEGGRGITEQEKVPIKKNVCEAIVCVATQKQLDAAVDGIFDRLVAKLGGDK